MSPIKRKRTHTRLSPANLAIKAAVTQANLQQFTDSSPLRPTSPSIGENREKAVIRSRVVVQGTFNEELQRTFEEKQQTTVGELPGSGLWFTGLGVASRKGLKPQVPNQDDYCLILDPAFTLCCVLDGHGKFGQDIADYVKVHLPPMVLEGLESADDPSAVLAKCFEVVNAQLYDKAEPKNFNSEYSGTTATLALIVNSRLYIAHVGDSAGVLGKRSDDSVEAWRLTPLHKPNHPEEKARILGNGGEIHKLPDDMSHRIFGQNSNSPALSISRTIGDLAAQKIGVVPTPDVRTVDLTAEDEYLVICSDGVWEFVSDQEALDLVQRFGSNCMMAADQLVSTAWSQWIQAGEQLVDDITAVVVYLPWIH